MTPDDVKAIAAAYETAKPINKGDIRSLVAGYRSDANPDWERLAKGTKKLWSDALDRVLDRWANVPLRLWSDPRMVTQVVKWRDEMKDTPRAADTRIASLNRLLAYGRLRGLVTINVAADIPTIYQGGHRAEVIWTQEDFDHFAEAAQQPVWDAIRLASMTGLRRQDLVTLRWSDIGEFAVQITALKKSAGKRRRVVVPIIPGLEDLLADLRTRTRKPGVDTVLVTMHGTSWTVSGLNSSIQTTRNNAREIIGHDAKGKPIYGRHYLAYEDDEGKKKWKRLHDVRGTFATKLMTIPGARLTDREIAEVMGWEVEQVAEIRRRYVDDAAIVVALGKRLANIDVNQTVN
ncbi:MAG: hypothetical protein QM647_13155 [Asticcacaulis sp.]|uniref:tyrosine-type recombinase/integrase n=1 Tax=Asticcacaulis sp. TaxID=1872648 RepID=UPI0039E2306A